MAGANSYSNESYSYTARSSNGRRYRRRRRRRTSFFYGLLILMILSLALILIFTTLFRVDNIIVEGDTRYDKTKIASLSGIQYRENLFQVDTKAAAYNIESQMSYLEDVTIRTRLLGTVVITVNEAKPVVAMEYRGKYILLSSNLKILQMDVDILPVGTMLVHGMEVRSPQEGFTAIFTEEDEEKALVLKDILHALEENELTEINSLDLTQILDIKMEYGERIAIKLGTRSRMDRKLSDIRYILDTAVESNTAYVIDATLLESESARVSLLAVDSLEAYYSGGEAIAPDDPIDGDMIDNEKEEDADDDMDET